MELLSCRFIASPEEIVRQQITYRYNAVKSRLSLMQARLADVNALVSPWPPSRPPSRQPSLLRLPVILGSLLLTRPLPFVSQCVTRRLTLPRMSSALVFTQGSRLQMPVIAVW